MSCLDLQTIRSQNMMANLLLANFQEDLGTISCVIQSSSSVKQRGAPNLMFSWFVTFSFSSERFTLLHYGHIRSGFVVCLHA